MRGGSPDARGSGAVIELSSDDLVEVDENRASIIAAAATAQNIAMLTGTHGVVSPPLTRPRARLPAPEEIHPGALPDPDDAELGRLRAFVTARSNAAPVSDPVGELRARLELAHAELDRGRLDAARKEAANAALVCAHAPAAHAMLRALHLGRAKLEEQLAEVSHLVDHAANERSRADWLCERARLLEARDGVSDESVAVWNAALASVPDHPGALYGLEVALDKVGQFGGLAEVLSKLAELVKDNEVSAWLHVERALLLDRRVGDVASATAAFIRALELAPGVGPVRAAFVDHVFHHRDDARLAGLLESEASIETDASRSARLELDAALAHLRAGSERARSVKVLERAHGRAPTSPLVDARIAEELVRIYEADGRHGDVLRVRKTALAWVSDTREELVELRAIATASERAGEIEDAVHALERARMLEPDDSTLLGDLDRLLGSAGRHEARAVLWMRHAADVEEPAKKARALLTSADASRAAGKDADAARQREAAWLTAPMAPGVYDALAERLAPIAPAQAVQERIGLYEQAIVATKDPDRKIHLLEKLAWLRDDVAGDAVGAMRLYEEILAIEPARLSSIVGLASAATRAGDDRALARALSAQADVTSDIPDRLELRLRASEALASVDPERALAQAEALYDEPGVRARAAELVTRFHATAARWDRVAETLAKRAAEAADGPPKLALILAEADVHLRRLRAPASALAALARLPSSLAGDPAARALALEALEVLGDEERLAPALAAMAEDAKAPLARARLLLRSAELDERRGRDAEARAGYERALSTLPDEPFLVDRLARLGARTSLGEVSAEVVSPLAAAVRTLDAGDGSAEPLLATGARNIATLRTAERLARRAGSAPQLANALALTAEVFPSGMVASRALEGLASLVAWTLPESDDSEPWERLLALGSSDVSGLDLLVQRARGRVAAGDPDAIQASIHALARRLETANDDTERLLIHLDSARLRRRASAIQEAAVHCRLALDADPSSLSAACLLAELSAELDDEELSIVASRAIAGLLADDKARAELLRDAADLCATRGDKALAAELLEQSLHADPEGVQTAARLSDIQRSRGAFVELGRVLRETLIRSQTTDAIVPIASELAEIARNNLKDPIMAITALERVREVAPGHVPSLFLLAELFIAQRAWDKALVALKQTVLATNEAAEKLVALVGRASIYRRVMNQPILAEVELRAALEIDPHDTRALRGLLDLGASVPNDERASLLGRLVIGESTPGERLRALIELAEARRLAGDVSGAEGALVEAASLSPDLSMLERVRAAIGNDVQTLARVLSRAVARAHEGERPIDPAWLIGLGHIELDLGRFDEAIERFEEALRTDESRDDARVALARALAARGRHEPAVAALVPVIVSPRRRMPIDANLVRLLESSLSGAGRHTEQSVARELRAMAGDLGRQEQAELDARNRNVAALPEGLSAEWLRRSVMPGILGRHPIWDVAALALPFAGKLARLGLAEQGSSTRERVKPRAAHPIRPLFDRVAKAFELVEIELAVSEHITAPAIACEDVPWVIVPAALGSMPDAHALAALARPMARIALGVPWLGVLGSHEVLAILVAFARQVAPGFSAVPKERVEPLVQDFDQRARRAIDRKRRKLLEELEPVLDRAPPVDEAKFAEAVLATEARAAFLLSGSLRASLDAVAEADAGLAEALRVPGPPSLAAVFGRASSRDLASFALESETTALRRSLGLA
jgi:tetratricopeptide (TPR) repeat protein